MSDSVRLIVAVLVYIWQEFYLVDNQFLGDALFSLSRVRIDVPAYKTVNDCHPNHRRLLRFFDVIRDKHGAIRKVYEAHHDRQAA